MNNDKINELTTVASTVRQIWYSMVDDQVKEYNEESDRVLDDVAAALESLRQALIKARTFKEWYVPLSA